MSSRTVKPDAKAVRDHRQGKGLTTAGLARVAGCSQRTVASVEAGSRVYPYTLARIAEALKVKVETLIEGDAPPVAARRGDRVWKFEIILKPDFEDYDEATDLPPLAMAIAKLLSDQNVGPLRLDPGSVRITYELALDEIVAVLESYTRDELAALDISEIMADAPRSMDFHRYFEPGTLLPRVHNRIGSTPSINDLRMTMGGDIDYWKLHLAEYKALVSAYHHFVGDA